MIVQTIELPAKPVFHRNSFQLRVEVEFDNVCAFIQTLCRGRYVAGTRNLVRLPACDRFVSMLVIVFITENQLRPMGQREAKINPRSPVVEVKVVIDSCRQKRRWTALLSP